MNRLQHETSPYLREHADDPVDWHPWGTDALELAQREKRPVLLSIGYHANHRCRKMARESFENKKVADFMNANYVNILVDREERPDLDRVYQNAQQLLNRQPGGWPLTMFLDPNDQLPLFGGTYFPAQQTRNQPSFRDVLSGIAKTYTNQNEKMKEFKTKLREALAPAQGSHADGDFDPTLIDRACGQIDSSFDAKYGGFAEEPKLPHPAGLEMMLDAIECVDETVKADRLTEMLDFTLLAMSRGGLYDHLGGGFFGRSIDPQWDTPDFEKLLGDNAALLSLYSRQAARSGSGWFNSVSSQTVEWMMREMQLEHGGFAASQGADVDYEEGKFYVWQRDDIAALLGDGYDEFAAAHGLTRKPNFGIHWHLRCAAPDPENWRIDEAFPDFSEAKSVLFDARAARASTARDEQVVTTWNAQAIRGLADAAICLDRADCADAAMRAADYLRENHWRDGRLLATTCAGDSGQPATVDDHAALLDALMKLLSVRWRSADLEFAITIADAMLERFEDPDAGGFFVTANDREPLIQRMKYFGDDLTPGANGNAVLGLLELGYLLGEPRYIDAAERALRAGVAEAENWPSAHATLMRGLMDFTQPAPRALIRCRDAAAADPWSDAVVVRLSGRTRRYVVPVDEAVQPGALGSRGIVDGAAVSACVCVADRIGEPVTELDAFKAALD